MKCLIEIIGCIDDYDPDALAVDQARAVVRAFITPVTTNERVALRSALGRVLGEDIVSTLDVPAHDNSAMDGYALRHADLAPAAGDRVRIPAGQKRGQNRRLAGEDLAAGKAVLRSGTAIGPAQLGLLASLGLAEIA